LGTKAPDAACRQPEGLLGGGAAADGDDVRQRLHRVQVLQQGVAGSIRQADVQEDGIRWLVGQHPACRGQGGDVGDALGMGAQRLLQHARQALRVLDQQEMSNPFHAAQPTTHA